MKRSGEQTAADSTVPADPGRRRWLARLGLSGVVAALGLPLPRGADAAEGGEQAGHAPFAPGMPVGERPYGLPSPFMRGVVRRWLRGMLPSRLSNVAFTPLAALEGIITPNGLHFERSHAGTPAIDPARHRLAVHGLVERPMAFSLADLKRLLMA